MSKETSKEEPPKWLSVPVLTTAQCLLALSLTQWDQQSQWDQAVPVGLSCPSGAGLPQWAWSVPVEAEHRRHFQQVSPWRYESLPGLPAPPCERAINIQYRVH